MPTYLRQKGSGDLYLFTAAMSKRSDMEIVDESDLSEVSDSTAAAETTEGKVIEEDVTESLAVTSDEVDESDAIEAEKAEGADTVEVEDDDEGGNTGDALDDLFGGT